METFVPGVELNRLFYEEVVGPLMAAQFPDLVYSAALIGYGSDVLGYDTTLSTDHEWGPRLLLFLEGSDEAAFYRVAGALNQTFQQHLPATFRGYSTTFWTRMATYGARDMYPVTPNDTPRLDHHIQMWTVDEFLRWELGVDSVDHLRVEDWLRFPEQMLLEVTAGAVYHDGLGQLVPIREQLSYYPHDIWLYRLAAQWRRIAQEESFVGRSGDVGDDLGSHLVAARLVRDVMRLCFLLERHYAPYSKWWGTAFACLACAPHVGPQLCAALAAATWQEREECLAHVYETVAECKMRLPLPSRKTRAPAPIGDVRSRSSWRTVLLTALIAAIQDPDVLSDHAYTSVWRERSTNGPTAPISCRRPARCAADSSASSRVQSKGPYGARWNETLSVN